jgi:HK97 gp10 family phage protein
VTEISVRLGYIRVKEESLWAPGGAPYIAAERAARAAVKHVKDELIRFDAIDSGELYNSIKSNIYRQGKSVVISVGSDSKHAKYVEYGTRSPIPRDRPKNMPIQIKNGPFLIRDRVQGQSPKPYLRNALKSVASRDWY